TRVGPPAGRTAPTRRSRPPPWLLRRWTPGRECSTERTRRDLLTSGRTGLARGFRGPQPHRRGGLFPPASSSRTPSLCAEAAATLEAVDPSAADPPRTRKAD